LATGVSKCYRVYETPQARLKQVVAPRLAQAIGLQPRQYYKEFWALHEMSFAIRRGETVGVIGRNGSGKSTLLQLIAGTLTLSSGTIQLGGRVAALLELGSGFHPEFTGRENVFMNAAVLGVGRKEIEARFADIAAFAEIGEFIEQPVKTYSSGMVMRLAFAVSTFVSPDVLIIDEALAVGDAAFQAKCMLSLRRFQESGGTVLFVSHDITAVRALCQRAIYLDHGNLLADGEVGEVTARYQRDLQASTNIRLDAALPPVSSPVPELAPAATPPIAMPSAEALQEFAARTAQCRHGAGGARVLSAELTDLAGARITSAAFDQPVRINILIEGQQRCRLSANFRICDKHQILILGGDFLMERHELLEVDAGTLHWVSYESRLPLLDGDYTLRISLTKPIDQHRDGVFVEIVEIAQVFSVQPPEHVKLWTAVYVPNQLTVQSLDSGCRPSL
jgi:lipopolysaccharide transport system ATP-binding protein